MTWRDVTMVRIYLTESEGKLDELLHLLHDQERVRGVTVYRGITGYGKSRAMHESRWAELGADLPLVVEFFDLSAKADMVLKNLSKQIEPGHLVTWSAKANLED